MRLRSDGRAGRPAARGYLISTGLELLTQCRFGQRAVPPSIPPLDAHHSHHIGPPRSIRAPIAADPRQTRESRSGQEPSGNAHAVLVCSCADHVATGFDPASPSRTGSTSSRRAYSAGAPVAWLKAPTRKIADNTLDLRRAAGRSGRLRASRSIWK